MVILASRPVGGYLGGKTAQGFDYLEQDSSLIIETDLCLFSSIICFFSQECPRGLDDSSKSLEGNFSLLSVLC